MYTHENKYVMLIYTRTDAIRHKGTRISESMNDVDDYVDENDDRMVMSSMTKTTMITIMMVMVILMLLSTKVMMT